MARRDPCNCFAFHLCGVIASCARVVDDGGGDWADILGVSAGTRRDVVAEGVVRASSPGAPLPGAAAHKSDPSDPRAVAIEASSDLARWLATPDLADGGVLLCLWPCLCCTSQF